MTKILFSRWMQELDAETINGIGIPSIVLMENASKGAADFFAKEFPLPDYKHVIVIAGKGNNGGDGFAAGRILFQKGYNVEFVLLSTTEKLNPDPRINFNIIKNLNLSVTIVESENQLKKISAIFDKHHYYKEGTFIIDAIFGTGLDKPVKPGLYSEVIRSIDNSTFKVAAIDIPSGLSDSFLPGEGMHVKADVTATFQSLKTAHLHPDGNKHCGKIQIIDIGIPQRLIDREKYYIHLTGPDSFGDLLKSREIDAHKGTYGHSLTICGSVEKPGAGILSSFAVLKSGAGLCTAAVCVENRTLPASAHPELMTLVYKENSDLLERLKEFNALLIGPGMGSSERTAGIVSLMIEKARVPLVLDADAVNVLQTREGKDLLKSSGSHNRPIIITPHPGEFSRLTGRPVSEINKNRIGISKAFAGEFNVYVILKGHHTIIATPGGQVYVNPTGNPGMATAGSGDVLSGMITGMVSQFSQNHPLDIILQAAVFNHGYAGDLAVKKTGEISLTAADIIDFIPAAFLHVDDYRTPFQFSR